MNINILLLSLSISILFFASCEISEQKLFDQRTMQLKNVNDFGATPLHDEFEASSEQLANNVQAFSDDITLENLNTIKTQWRTTANLFKRCELYDIGEVNGSFIHFRIHRWPIDAERLEDSLQSTLPLTYEDFSGLGSSILGIAALEHLLFENDANTTLLQFQNEPKRLTYLKFTADYLKEKATELNSIWKDYSSFFITALETEIAGGQNQMTNTLAAYLDESVKARLAKPLGEESGLPPNKNLLEAPISDASLNFIRSGFGEWKRCFSGEYANSTNNYGFDDYLVALDNQDLVNRINTAVQDCDNALANLTSLNQDLETETAKVIALNDTFKALVILIKVDMGSFINAIITPNDADGD